MVRVTRHGVHCGSSGDEMSTGFGKGRDSLRIKINDVKWKIAVDTYILMVRVHPHSVDWG